MLNLECLTQQKELLYTIFCSSSIRHLSVLRPQSSPSILRLLVDYTTSTLLTKLTDPLQAKRDSCSYSLLIGSKAPSCRSGDKSSNERVLPQVAKLLHSGRQESFTLTDRSAHIRSAVFRQLHSLTLVNLSPYHSPKNCIYTLFIDF